MKKKLICTLLTAVLFLCTGAAAFAEEPEEMLPAEPSEYVISEDSADLSEPSVQPLTVVKMAIGYKKTSSTKVTAIVTGSSSASATYLHSTVCPQKYSSSKKKYVTVSGTTVTKKVTKMHRIEHRPVYSISASGKYRIKATIKDNDTSMTRYQTIS